ncbi:hypothetical protein DM01DRAFT_1332846 [Hesseltinella vesiculosa]|uniref:Autophagy-related protein 14 n=1 Tax=Hesseltinella vesiculosa TaxID=101127 RepID=A0A1X2GTA0_9FUNG|nr:hypothetical protein DM01DRAFT_1332846 [Hesseltinella vesiculosa]
MSTIPPMTASAPVTPLSTTPHPQGSQPQPSPEQGMLDVGSALMKRSESTTSVHSYGSLIADSSITKHAYSPLDHHHRPEKSPSQLHTLSPSSDAKSLLDAIATLTVQPRPAPFYTTTMIPNSTNPCFPIDLTSTTHWYEGVQSCFTVQVWARHSIPESPVLAVSSLDSHHHPTDDPSYAFCLLIEWVVDINELTYIGKSLEDVHNWPPNTLLFELQQGFYTSPDVAVIVLGSSNPFIRRGLPLMDAVQSPRTKRSYTYHHIMQLNTLKACVFDAQCAVHEVQANINDLLDTNAVRMQLMRERSQKETRLKELEKQAQDKKAHLDLAHDKVHQLRKRLQSRRCEINATRQRFSQEQKDLDNNERLLSKNTRMYHDTQVDLNLRQKELIADLFSIYPIEQSFDDFQQFRIRGLYLPNSVYAGCDEEVVATALGFTAHLVSMLAYYLAIPLRYPIDPMGSRASIHDPVSMIHGSRTFPLYSKGVDKYRFEFGVFLLNKNIEQMMNAYGLIVLDLRHTLPNIHCFIQAVLTTSVDSGPTSLSMLSISSFAQGRDRPSIDFTRLNDTKEHDGHDHHAPGEHHLTLKQRPMSATSTILAPRPSPTVSTQSSTTPQKKLAGSPSHVYAVHLPTQVSAAPAVLDAVTTSSCQQPHPYTFIE